MFCKLNVQGFLPWEFGEQIEGYFLQDDSFLFSTNLEQYCIYGYQH